MTITWLCRFTRSARVLILDGRRGALMAGRLYAFMTITWLCCFVRSARVLVLEGRRGGIEVADAGLARRDLSALEDVLARLASTTVLAEQLSTVSGPMAVWGGMGNTAVSGDLTHLEW